MTPPPLGRGNCAVRVLQGAGARSRVGGRTYDVGDRRVDALGGAEVHALDGDFWFGDEDGLAAGGIQVGVLDILQLQRAERGAVQ